MSSAKFAWGQRVRLIKWSDDWRMVGNYLGYSARIDGHIRGGGHQYGLRIYKNGKCVNKIAWIPESWLEAR